MSYASAATPSINYTVDSDWGSGYQATVKVVNPNPTPVANWQLQFDYPSSITSIWDGAIKSRTGTKYVISGAGWNNTIPASSSVSFGFVAAPGGTPPVPTGCVLNGVACTVSNGSQPAPTPPAPNPPTPPTPDPTPPASSSGLTASFKKSSDWGSGFIGEYTVKNNGTSTVNSWKVVFSLPASEKVTDAWSGTLSTSGNIYTLTNASWNGSLPPGGSATVGFQGTRGATWADPTSCTVNGQPCSGGPVTPDTTAPTAPSGLTIGTTTSASVALSWNVSTDNVGVVGYDIYRGSTKVGTATDTSFVDTGLQAQTTYSYTVKARDAAGNTSAASSLVNATTKATPPPGSSTAFAVAPYVDMTLWPPFDLAGAARDSGLRAASLAFIVSQSGCNASWGGVIPLADDADIAGKISAFRAAGGQVIVSFGGASGSELAQTCTSVSALQAQYQAVIDRYNLTRIDFDVEGGAVAEPASVERRNKAIAGLQSAATAKGKRLEVTYTLPVLPSGLTQDGVGVVRSAINNGADLTAVNVMAMDYGEYAAPNPAGRMGDYAIQSGTSLHAQLKTLYPSLTDAQVWKRVGITPMVGVNDVTSEVFTVSDAQKLVNFAAGKHLNMLAFWSMARDSQCPGGAQTYASPTCSSIVQSPFEFTKTFNAYTG